MSHLTRYKKESAESYALGVAPVLDLLKHHPKESVALYLHSDLSKELALKIKGLADKGGLSVENGTKPFTLLSPKENCFAIGVFKKYTQSLDDKANHVVLVNPSNTGNLGTIMRSCLGFGIQNIAVIRPAVDAFDPKCIRASMGAFFGIKFQYFDSFEAYQNQFKNHSFYPFMLKATATLQKLKNRQKFKFIVL